MCQPDARGGGRDVWCVSAACLPPPAAQRALLRPSPPTTLPPLHAHMMHCLIPASLNEVKRSKTGLGLYYNGAVYHKHLAISIWQ